MKVGHTQKWSTMAKGLPTKEKSADHNRKRIKNLFKAYAVKEKVIDLDQLVFTNLPLLRTYNLDAASTECDLSFLF